jgi:hypothetical protein
MAFSRKCEVTVGPKGGEGFIIDALKIAVSIEKTKSPDPNNSKSRISALKVIGPSYFNFGGIIWQESNGKKYKTG